MSKITPPLVINDSIASKNRKTKAAVVASKRDRADARKKFDELMTEHESLIAENGMDQSWVTARRPVGKELL